MRLVVHLHLTRSTAYTGKIVKNARAATSPGSYRSATPPACASHSGPNVCGCIRRQPRLNASPSRSVPLRVSPAIPAHAQFVNSGPAAIRRLYRRRASPPATADKPAAPRLSPAEPAAPSGPYAPEPRRAPPHAGHIYYQLRVPNPAPVQQLKIARSRSSHATASCVASQLAWPASSSSSAPGSPLPCSAPRQMLGRLRCTHQRWILLNLASLATRTSSAPPPAPRASCSGRAWRPDKPNLQISTAPIFHSRLSSLGDTPQTRTSRAYARSVCSGTALIREHRQKALRQLLELIAIGLSRVPAISPSQHTTTPTTSPHLADGTPDAPPSDAPAPHACTPASSQYPRAPAASARSSNPPHARPYASHSYAAVDADWLMAASRARDRPHHLPDPLPRSEHFHGLKKQGPLPFVSPSRPNMLPLSASTELRPSGTIRYRPCLEPAPEPGRDAHPPPSARLTRRWLPATAQNRGGPQHWSASSRPGGSAGARRSPPLTRPEPRQYLPARQRLHIDHGSAAIFLSISGQR